MMTPEELAALGDNTTPGPWRVGSRRLCDVETSGGALVADCGVGVADARLVAAAPELLAALVAALEEVERLRAKVARLTARKSAELPPRWRKCSTLRLTFSGPGSLLVERTKEGVRIGREVYNAEANRDDFVWNEAPAAVLLLALKETP
jgi:hypothetical protein